jgi:PAS domain S-box-containing protein
VIDGSEAIWVKDENKTKKQLIDELLKLRERNMALELALKDRDYSFTASELSPPNRWFTTGRSELFVSNTPEQQAVNQAEKFKLADLVDIPTLQQLLNSFYLATGIPYGLHDEKNNILSGMGWQDICSKFHRVCPQTELKCKQSDSYIATHLQDGPYVGYKCMNGLMDFGTPIIVEGQHLASIFLGQFLQELPDEDFFRRQAQKYGFDEAAYMEALRRVPVISEDQVGAIMEFYSELGRFLASMGLERKRQIKLAEQALKMQEERFSKAFYGNPDLMSISTLREGRYIEINDAFVEITGYERDEVIGRTNQELDIWVIPEQRDIILKQLQENGSIRNMEVNYRIKSGEIRTFMMSVEIIDIKGEAHLIVTTRDISERKQMEEALRLSEERFRMIFNSVNDAIFIHDLETGLIVDVNKRARELYGYSREEILRLNDVNLNFTVPPYTRKEFINRLKRAALGMPQLFQWRARSKAGHLFWVEVNLRRAAIGDKKQIISTVRDITKRKEIEDKLRFSEECLSKAFNTSPVVMTITTLEEGRFMQANNAFYSIIGFSHGEVIGKTSLEVGFWLDPADRNTVIQMLLNKQSIRNTEISFCKQNGEQRLGSYSAEVLDINGTPCILSVLTDITDIRQMEVEMNRLDRLNLVGEMAASIGHEIRNPMTTVRGYLQILRENKDYSQELEYFDLMIEELDRANSIITEFLSLAKNKLLDIKPININEIISKSLLLIQAKAISRDQYIRLEANEVPKLLLDEKEIRQLILNLVNNAMESMSARGEILVKTFIEKGKAVLAVKDQGYGIDHKYIEKLGTPFFTTKEQGTGLGLAVCYRIAARHDAKIDIETSSTGTTFFVRFPIPIGRESDLNG